MFSSGEGRPRTLFSDKGFKDLPRWAFSKSETYLCSLCFDKFVNELLSSFKKKRRGQGNYWPVVVVTVIFPS